MSEILGAIFKAIVALLSLGAVVGIGVTASNGNKNANAVAELSQLVFNVQASYPSGAFTSLTNTVATAGDKGSRMAPEGMISGTSLVNPWGGAVTVNVNAGNAARFDVTTASVSASGCQKLATNMGTALALSINGTAQTLPMDAGTATTACQNSPNSMAFTFGH
ncbi:type 4 pilus major pilin [Propionivibrio sp.]|uniref:type 4 pilus major pilin n=1 Tax=Propionivibrio sp. TaxID=2212460 RepID=UPI0039E2F356